jgi:hypothetical protein
VLNSYENVLIVLVTVAAAVCFLFLVRRCWPSELRQKQNDLIGWNVGVLGSTYAVIIGFMLFPVWTNFETADSNADTEANSLVNLADYSRGLPAEQRSQILTLAREYARVMVTKEWPAMSRVKLSPESHAIARQLWTTLLATKPTMSLEQSSLDHTLQRTR